LIAEMTYSTIAWYRDRLGYLSDDWRIVSVARVPWSEVPLSIGRQRNQSRPAAYVVRPDVTHVFGGYWDVYRTAFLSGKKVVGVPYPMYPNRFQGWSHGLGPDRGMLLVLGVRREPTSIPSKRRGSSPVLSSSRGLDRSTAINWKSPFELVWQNDGRNLSEVDRIRVTIPSVERVGR
jgi:hypothetical protein